MAVITLYIHICIYIFFFNKNHSIRKGSVFFLTIVTPHTDIPEGSDLQKLLLM